MDAHARANRKERNESQQGDVPQRQTTRRARKRLVLNEDVASEKREKRKAENEKGTEGRPHTRC